MATRDAQIATSAGISATAHGASGGGDQVPPDALLRVINGSGSTVTLTIDTPGTVDGDLAIANRTVAVTAGQAKYVRAGGKAYRNPTTGRVHLSWSATADVTFEVIK